MENREGPFKLVSVVGQTVGRPYRWHAVGYVHADGEDKYLEQIGAGTEFESREAATAGGIDAARAVARTLPPDDSLKKRKAGR